MKTKNINNSMQARIIGLAVVAVALCALKSSANPYGKSTPIGGEKSDKVFHRPAETTTGTSVSTQAVASEHKMLVKAYEVHGNTMLTQQQIDEALAGYINRMLSSEEISAAGEALRRAYVLNDYFTTKVLIPDQSIAEGVVTIHVFEGLLEDNGIHLANSGKRVKSAVLSAILNNNLTHGVMTTAEFERTILLADDLPGITTHSTIYPGEVVDTADYLMQVYDLSILSGNIDYDNFGSWYTGNDRLGTTLYLNSPTKMGDQLTLRYVTSGKDSNYGFVSYTIPVHGKGWVLGFSTDYLDYELGKQYRDIEAAGTAADTHVYLTYPIIRSRHGNLIARADYSMLKVDDHNNEGFKADRDVRSGILRLSGDHDDDLFANGVTYFDFSLTAGSVDLNSNDEFISLVRSSCMSDGDFLKLNYNISRLQHIGGHFSTLIGLDGQVVNGNLDPSQKYYLGGPFSVAGYPTGEASGDDAAVGHIDLRYDIPQSGGKGAMQLSVLYAYGWTKLHHEPWDGWEGDNTLIENNIILQSVGVGVTQSWDESLVIRAVLGRQIGENLGRNPVTGKDSDDSDSDYRTWIQAIYYF